MVREKEVLKTCFLNKNFSEERNARYVFKIFERVYLCFYRPIRRRVFSEHVAGIDKTLPLFQTGPSSKDIRYPVHQAPDESACSPLRKKFTFVFHSIFRRHGTKHVTFCARSQLTACAWCQSPSSPRNIARFPTHIEHQFSVMRPERLRVREYACRRAPKRPFRAPSES